MDKAQAVIRKVGDEFCVFSHSGKNLGCSPSREGAEKRLRQVEYFKHKDKGSAMNYDNAFANLAKALRDDIDPKTLGQAPDGAPKSVDIQSELSVSDRLRVGTIASRTSDRILDNKDHFPVITETQAQSSMARVLQLTEAPAWYKGTLAELRQDVYKGIVELHPDIQLNVRVPVEQAVGLSDGQTPAETSKQSVKDPADVAKKEVPQVARPHLTSAQVAEALDDEATRQVIAGRLMEMVEKQIENLNSAKKIASRLLKSGVKAEEFDALSTYIQEAILYELMQRASTASSTQAEDRRRELLNRMGARKNAEA